MCRVISLLLNCQPTTSKRCATNEYTSHTKHVPADASFGRSELLARRDGCEVNLIDGEALSEGTAGGADRTTGRRVRGGRSRRRSVGVGPRAVGEIGHCFVRCVQGHSMVLVSWRARAWESYLGKILSTPGKPMKEGSDRTWRARESSGDGLVRTSKRIARYAGLTSKIEHYRTE